MCISEIKKKRYSRSLEGQKTWLWIHLNERLTGLAHLSSNFHFTYQQVFSKLTKHDCNKTLGCQSQDFFSFPSVFFWHLEQDSSSVSFTDSRTCAGCAPVAGQHVGKRLSAPWGRPASCLWSPPLAADGSGSSLPGGRTPPSGSVS